MPTYVYACRSCGHRFEVVQSMTEEPLTRCPECEGELRKVYAPPAIAFRGSGFYATDHGKKTAKTESGKADGDGSKGDGGSESAGGSKGDGGSKAKGDGGSKAKGAPGSGPSKDTTGGGSTPREGSG
jgi:putative FmdB family regulatory protein